VENVLDFLIKPQQSHETFKKRRRKKGFAGESAKSPATQAVEGEEC
jgi:hypothetical protein